MNLHDRDTQLGSVYESRDGLLWTVMASDHGSLRVSVGGLSIWVGAAEFWRLVQRGELVPSARVA